MEWIKYTYENSKVKKQVKVQISTAAFSIYNPHIKHYVNKIYYWLQQAKTSHLGYRVYMCISYDSQKNSVYFPTNNDWTNSCNSCVISKDAVSC